MSHNPPSSTPSLVPATTALTTLATALAAPAAEPTAVDKAFEALKGYTYGSPRGDLTPLDRAVESAIGDETAKRALEKRLLTALEGNPPAVGKEYICGKLGLIGSAGSVSALVAELGRKEVAVAARSALESLRSPEADMALLASLSKLSGLAKAGAATSLGRRGSAASVKPLSALLKDPDPQVVAAALAALGDIGVAEAARVLTQFLPSAPAALRAIAADAGLRCVDRASARGQRNEAAALCRLLSQPDQPRHVQAAAKRIGGIAP